MRIMMPKMKICAFWVLALLVSGCACSTAPVVYSASEAHGLMEKSWEYTEVPCMEREKEYPLPGGRHTLMVAELADAEFSKCLACLDSSGKLVPLAEGERTFGYAVCRQIPQYLLVFDNYASRQNRVLLFKLSSSRLVLCYDGAEFDGSFECCVVWRVAAWNRQGILLEGYRDDASCVYRLLPLE
jgi:hypothetical protein